MENFKSLVLSRCNGDVTEEIKSTKTQKEFLDWLFEDIGEHLRDKIVSPDELVGNLSPIELFHYGFLTQDNNPIDFTQLVNIGGVKWYNQNEDLGVINEEDDDLFEYQDKKIKDEDGEVYDTCIRKLKVKFDDKRLPKTEELEIILNCEENLGYYNGILSKVYDKKLVFPIFDDVGYISEMRKSDESYQCLYVSLDDESYIGDSGGEMLIRCIKSRSKPLNKKPIELQNQDNTSNLTAKSTHYNITGEITVTKAEISEAQTLLDDLRARLEELNLQGKNVVIVGNTFPENLPGIIRNLLVPIKSKEVVGIKKTTHCVLIGDKKKVAKSVLQKIEEQKQNGTGISAFMVSVSDSPNIVISTTPVDTNVDITGYLKRKRLFRKIAIVLWCIVGFFFLMILLGIIFGSKTN